MRTAIVSIAAYLLITLLYAAAQIAHASLRRRNAVTYLRTVSQGAGGDHKRPPSVDVLVACYNEQPELLDACLTALETERTERYAGAMRILVVDDASKNFSGLLPVFLRHPTCILYPLERNLGKRRALDVIAREGNAEIVVVVDSDTMVEPGAIREIVRLFQNGRVGAVCGNLRPLEAMRPRNVAARLLFRMVDQEYWRLFERTRASQSRFGTVLCCNGGFSAYRRSALWKVWDQHVNDTTFLGRHRNGGDDLHLTLLILQRGYDAVFQPTARALTDVPADFVRYCRQQYRWSRSFVREFWLAFRVVQRRHTYPAVDLLVQAATPLALAVTLLIALTGYGLRSSSFAQQGSLLVVVGVSTVAAAALQARGAHGFLYGSMQLALVFPLRLLALLTWNRDTWKTRVLRVPDDRASGAAEPRVAVAWLPGTLDAPDAQGQAVPLPVSRAIDWEIALRPAAARSDRLIPTPVSSAVDA